MIFDVIYGCTLCEKPFGNFRFGFSQFILKSQEAPIVFEIQNNFHFDANQNKESFDVVAFQVGNSKYVFEAIRMFFSQVIAFLNGIPPLNWDNFNSTFEFWMSNNKDLKFNFSMKNTNLNIDLSFTK